MVISKRGMKFNSERVDPASTHIWSFDVSTGKWERKLAVNDGYSGSTPMVATSDGNYLIILYTKYKCFDVLDMRDERKFKIRECSIKLEIDSNYDSLLGITGGIQDTLLIHGWIRALFKRDSFSALRIPPQYLMQVIERHYHHQERIHVLQGQSVHQIFNLDKVLTLAK